MSNHAFVEAPGLYLALDLNLHILAAGDAYLPATMTRRAEIIDRRIVEVFPDNSDDPSADALRNS